MSLIDNYDALLLDLDGTVWAGAKPIPSAVEAITEATGRGLRAAYVTNNASKSPADVAAKLSGIGLAATPDEVMTSAQAAVLLIDEHAKPHDNVLVIGAPSFVELVREAGYNPVFSADDEPVVVVHGHSPENGWRQLSEAALAIQRGAVYLASNVDSTLPSERGFMVGNGSMVAAVTNATGVVPTAAGKPGPAMFRLVAEKIGASRALVVGDRLDTDIAGGVAAEMDTLHVLTGVSGPWSLIAAPPSQRPTFVARDLSEAVLADPDSLRPGAGGGFRAELVGSDAEGKPLVRLEVPAADADLDPIAALRTVLGVVWGLSVEENGTPAVVSAADDKSRAAVEAWW